MRLAACSSCVLAGLFVLAHVASAQAPGLAVRWDSCYGDNPAGSNKTFACNTNDGFEQLVGSFELGESMDQVTGNEIVVDLFTANSYGLPTGVPLPEWWQFVNPGSCRQAVLHLAVSTALPIDSCPDWSAGQASGAIVAFLVETRGTGSARIKILSTVGLHPTAYLEPGVEYFSFVLKITNDKTVGAGACTGCDVPILIYANEINITTTDPAKNRLMTGPLNGTDSNFVTWGQLPVPARRSTWGAVKARYH